MARVRGEAGRLLVARHYSNPQFYSGTIKEDLGPWCHGCPGTGIEEDETDTITFWGNPQQLQAIPAGTYVTGILMDDDGTRNRNYLVMWPDPLVIKGQIITDLAAPEDSQNPTYTTMKLYGFSVEYQQIRVANGPATGGAFQLRYDGQNSEFLGWDCTAAEVQTEVDTITGVTGLFTASGGPFPDEPIKLESPGASLQKRFTVLFGFLEPSNEPEVKLELQFREQALEIEIVNRDPSLEAFADNFCIAKKIGDEWNPIWLGCL